MPMRIHAGDFQFLSARALRAIAAGMFRRKKRLPTEMRLARKELKKRRLKITK